MTGTVYSIGHGTATAEDFTRTLVDAGVRLLADIRSAPGSRRNPQFGQSPLRDTLVRAGIEYVHLPGLGGRRAARPDSPHTGLRVAAFRGYAASRVRVSPPRLRSIYQRRPWFCRAASMTARIARVTSVVGLIVTLATTQPAASTARRKAQRSAPRPRPIP
jgi:Protein of unknown function, DUF488